MFRSKSILAALVPALFTLAHPAFAEDGKTMPGSACQALNDVPARNHFRALGSLINYENSFEFFLCPVVKDLNKIKRAVVMVKDLNPDAGADSYCSLYTLRSDGTIQSVQVRNSTGSSAAPQALKFGAQGAVANGYYALQCSLPAYHPTFRESAIVSYTLVEE